MVLQRPSWIVWGAPVAFLMFALLPLPYGFYALLRLVVCAAFVYLAFWQYRRDGRLGSWAVALLFLALLFNPLMPVHLMREIWAFLDIGAALVLATHFLLTKRTAATS